MRLKFLFLFPVLTLVLSGCDKTVAEHKATVYVFGTLVEVILRDVEEDHAEEIVAELQKDFQRMHKAWHAWKPGELGELNAAIAKSEKIEISDFLKEPLLKAQEFAALSEGLFNSAIGKIIAEWGFHADELPKGQFPNLDDIRKLAGERPRMTDLFIEGNLVSSSNPNVSLDFGGFGKGYALDIAEEKLKEKGIQHAVLNAGGDINTIGNHGKRPWNMAIRHPFVEWDVIASVNLKPDEELYTSGNYERFRELDGVKYAHILNPVTGMPVDHIVSASVLHDNGALADAAATALTVAGVDSWHHIARRMGVKYVLLIDENGEFHLNPAMKERLKIPDGVDPVFHVSEPL